MALQVQPPARQARLGGIKSVIGDFIDSPRLAAVMQGGGIAWEDPGCGRPSRTQAGCYDTVVAPAEKERDGYLELTSIGDPFAIYVGKECYLGGDDDQSYADQATALLEAWEDREVEKELWQWAADAANPDTAASVREAIGLAEQHADANYVGQPVLVMSRAAAEAAGNLISWEGGQSVTRLGTPVIATGSADADDVITIVGRPAVYASPTKAYPSVNTRENLGLAIAERVVAVGVDCDYRHAVSVSTTP